MTAECPVNPMTCDRCDYRKAREGDYTAKAICELCANYTGENE